MDEANISIREKNASLGKIEIAPEVLEVISGVATHEVEGVYAMQGSFKSGVNELLGRSAHNKGVHLEMDENGLSVDIYCYIKYARYCAIAEPLYQQCFAYVNTKMQYFAHYIV